MLKNSLVLVLTDEKENEICDFVKRTCIFLSGSGNDAILINTSNSLSIKELLINYLGRSKKCWHFIRKYNGYYQVSPIFFFPFRRYNWVVKFNLLINTVLIHFLFRFKKGFKYSKLVFWIFFPKFYYFLPVLKLFKFHTHFDIIDFFTSSNQEEENILHRSKKAILQKADTVSAISSTLKSQYQKIHGRRIEVVPQGFSISLFKKIRKIRIKKVGPIIGYVGAISSRFDISLLKNLVAKNPQWTFLFVGPKKVDKNISNNSHIENGVEEIFKLKNASWIGSLPKKYIASIINIFDIGIIPYDHEYRFNQYSFPMKLFEYLYLGKPVVSAPIKELKRKKYHDAVFLAKNYSQWRQIITEILKRKYSNKEYLLKSKKLSQENTWEMKIEAVSQVIENS